MESFDELDPWFSAQINWEDREERLSLDKSDHGFCEQIHGEESEQRSSFDEFDHVFSEKIDGGEREERLEEEEEFRSCFAEEDEWTDAEESMEQEPEEEFSNDLDEFRCKMFFKGVSVAQGGDLGASVSGIGVVLQKSDRESVMQVQKKLDFCVEESVAEQLALMDGLLSALRIGARRIMAFTDSTVVYDQIAHAEKLENQLLVALRQRILEHAGKLEAFVLQLVPSSDLKKPLRLAREAIGLIDSSAEGDQSLEDCSICCEEKQPSQMITMNCSHKFCSHCMITYVDKKLQASQVPVRCPQLRCKYYISAGECKSFLPVSCYKSLLKALAEADIHNSEKLYCPYPNCSVLLNLRHCLSTRASSSSSQSEPGANCCVECPECRRLICVDCGVPWHSSMSCEEYQNLPLEERDAGDITLHRLAQNKKWRRCQQCRRMIELTQGCYHMTCWCGHEFCYSCGAEYRERQQTCQCAFWDDENLITNHALSQESELWRWDGDFDSMHVFMEGCTDQERAQLALIQRFLAGGLSLSDHLPCQPTPPSSESYLDAMKDLQLPWLERFMSVISDDSYYDDYVPQ